MFCFKAISSLYVHILITPVFSTMNNKLGKLRTNNISLD